MVLHPLPRQPLQLWGGIECTVNRVGEQFFDQVALSGHARRIDDLDRIASLGIRTLRYPALWEWAAPHQPDEFNWAWADERLSRLGQLGISPIVGLVHHGSGPRYTNLLDPDFATGLARYAGRLAERYPWIDMYTPVNEPLTTARFSALYGHWYPHARDARLFVQALLNQCRAIVFAMKTIRGVRPDARLVQTEDLGKTHSTQAMRYQADFENERRWITFDLLCGRVDRQHPLVSYFRHIGIAESEWTWFLDYPCPPDVIGINHYLTSERFLDERLERYPLSCHGGNGRHTYADVEAVRVCPSLAGPRELLGEAWARYGLPLAITEAHLGCTREEQMRWLVDVWHQAQDARREGADVRAVTIWAMLGLHDWDSLVTQCRGHYEPGAFDLRSARPRQTALADLAEQLALGAEPDHPVLGGVGWWRRPQRFSQPRDSGGEALDREGLALPPAITRTEQPILITGGRGLLGQALVRVCAIRGLACRPCSRSELDITSYTAIETALQQWRPWAVINAAGYARIDDAEIEHERCYLANAHAPAVLTDVCARHGIALLTFSSDLVFDGQLRTPYCESASTCPLCVYGRSKVDAERQVLGRYPEALVIRSGAFFGPWDSENFVASTLRTLQQRGRVAAADDWYISPTYLPDLVHACLDLLIDGEHGIWHLANRGVLTWAELAREIARRGGANEAAVEARPVRSFGWPAARPAYSALGSERGLFLPTLDHALGCYFAAC